MKMRYSIIPSRAVYDRRLPFWSFQNSVCYVLLHLSQRDLLSITRIARKYKGRFTTNYLKTDKGTQTVWVCC
jgi:hypothetical protein